MSENIEFIDKLLKQYDYQRGALIPMMQDIQAEYEYLPKDVLKDLSKQLKVPLSQIYSVATFYSSFSLAPRGQHLITLCLGTVCYLKGAGKIAETIQAELQVEPGGTSPDRLFTFQPVNCLGACALAPIMKIDEEYYEKVTPEQVREILAGYESAEVEHPDEAGEE
ncbi:MAG: NADH-quinone oxidoreductase subunit NuoE [Candidatus Poribacteria bacterium]